MMYFIIFKFVKFSIFISTYFLTRFVIEIIYKGIPYFEENNF